MATLHKEQIVRVPAAYVWVALRDAGKAHEVFSGVLTDCRMNGDVRTVTFADGAVVDERIISIDNVRRRLAYAVVGGAFTHHSASMAIQEISEGVCRFVWISDFLPDALKGHIGPLVEAGSAALARNIVAAYARSQMQSS
jgi:Polyketide cyclase / dehydrase and lipid transport